MNRFFLILFSLLIILPSYALEQIDYKNIKNGKKLTFDGSAWSQKVNKKSDNYFVKKVPEGIMQFSEFYSPQNKFVFSTGCQYEFLYKGKLIGYSNQDLKFYEFTINNEILEQRELQENEISEMFEDFRIIKISDFSTATNSLKIKKKKRHLKIILLNDTDRYFNNYAFTSNNSKYEEYELKGFLDITKRGMIQFSQFGDNSKDKPWFILLVR